MPTFVLVQGAVVGGWCWRWVAPELRAAGHEVYTPTLTGLGERVHLASPEIDLDTHIEDILNVLRFEDLADVILVGWSYGGMVVAGGADRAPERIAHLVYLDSDVPRDGDTSVPPSQHAAREALARLHGDGWRVPPEAMQVEDLLLAELDEAPSRWISARFAPHLLKTWLQPIRLSGEGHSVPTTYVRCTIGYDPPDEDTQRQDERIRSERSWSYRELDASHAVPFTGPEALAELLLDIVYGRSNRPYDIQPRGATGGIIDHRTITSNCNFDCPPWICPFTPATFCRATQEGQHPDDRYASTPDSGPASPNLDGHSQTSSSRSGQGSRLLPGLSRFQPG